MGARTSAGPEPRQRESRMPATSLLDLFVAATWAESRAWQAVEGKPPGTPEFDAEAWAHWVATAQAARQAQQLLFVGKTGLMEPVEREVWR